MNRALSRLPDKARLRELYETSAITTSAQALHIPPNPAETGPIPKEQLKEQKDPFDTILCRSQKSTLSLYVDKRGGGAGVIPTNTVYSHHTKSVNLKTVENHFWSLLIPKI
jgi:hypothetical protein